jgi:hypothetical protein
MPIRITGKSTLRAIEEAFQAKYPHLRVEFFALNERGEYSHSLQHGQPYDRTLCELGTCNGDASFALDPGLRVQELERGFREYFGIGIVVLRRRSQTSSNSTENAPRYRNWNPDSNIQ